MFSFHSKLRQLLSVWLVFALFLGVMAFPTLSYASSAKTNAKVVLRKESKQTSKALQTLASGEEITILDTKGDWYKVRYGSYTGYIMKKYVVKSSENANVSRRIKAIGKAPGIMRVGDENSDVKKLQQALNILGYYNGSIDGKYGAATKKAVEEYQKDEGLVADGYAGERTVKHIFGSCSSKSLTTQPSPKATAKPIEKEPVSSTPTSTKKTYTTKVLDWFEDNVSRVIPKNAHFVIKDVQTGRTFSAVRWSGGSHMDAEPRTAEDTAIMKSIYGGSWSWRRRPILILYNEHVYAASMNGMPHGSDDIVPGNGFQGMFCIHFKNSKTHGSDKVDSEHQNAVEKAAKATW